MPTLSKKDEIDWTLYKSIEKGKHEYWVFQRGYYHVLSGEFINVLPLEIRVSLIRVKKKSRSKEYIPLATGNFTVEDWKKRRKSCYEKLFQEADKKHLKRIGIKQLSQCCPI